MILFNFNVLARPNSEFGARVPDPDGLVLWRSLHETSIGRISLVANEAPNRDILEHWLKVNQIKASAYDLFDTSDPQLVADKVHLFLAAAGGRHMYFDIDPEVIALTMRMGIPSILVCQPFVVRPEWSSPKAMRSWESLSEEIDRQKLARAEKTWGDPE